MTLWLHAPGRMETQGRGLIRPLFTLLVNFIYFFFKEIEALKFFQEENSDSSLFFLLAFPHPFSTGGKVEASKGPSNKGSFQHVLGREQNILDQNRIFSSQTISWVQKPPSPSACMDDAPLVLLLLLGPLCHPNIGVLLLSGGEGCSQKTP